MKINIGNSDKPNLADRLRPPTKDTERKGLGGMTRIRIIDEKPAEHNQETETEASDD